jgi:hypothetical protein
MFRADDAPPGGWPDAVKLTAWTRLRRQVVPGGWILGHNLRVHLDAQSNFSLDKPRGT